MSYSDFKCAGCGTCCIKQNGVKLTLYDLFRLSDFLKMRPTAFFRRYCQISKTSDMNLSFFFEDTSDDRLLYLKTKNGCPFLKENKCIVYDARPMVCRVYPFIFNHLPLAIYRLNTFVTDECCINNVKCDSILIGDLENIIDSDILTGITRDYFKLNKKFDEKTAKEYNDLHLADLKDQSLRNYWKESHDVESKYMEDKAKTDPSLVHGLKAFLNGSYDLHLREVKFLREHGHDVYPIHIIAHLVYKEEDVGKDDSILYFIVREEDYSVIRKELLGKEIDVKVKVLMSNQEYEDFTFSIIPHNKGKTITFFGGIDKKHKAIMKKRSKPGEIIFNFGNIYNNTFTCKGVDIDKWLSS